MNPRRLLKEGKNDHTEAYKIQNDMCIAGDYLRLLDPNDYTNAYPILSTRSYG